MLWMYEEWDQDIELYSKIKIIMQHTLKIKVAPKYYKQVIKINECP